MVKNDLKFGIEVQGLEKDFGELKVLEGIDFKVESGTISALLGPNGAGKTTTINILSTLLKPDSGTAKIDGSDIIETPDKVRRSIGLTGQFAAVDEYLSGRENLEMIGRLYHMTSGIKQRSSELLKKFDLDDAADRQVRTYSGGMKRRLDLAMSLISSPPIIFLDEPTTGLDPRSRLTLWQMIKDLADDGTTILLTTQYMEEAEQLAKDVVVIDHGKVIASGSPAKLKAMVGDSRIEIVAQNKDDVKHIQKLFKNQVESTNNDTLTVRISAKQGASSLKKAIHKVEEDGIKIVGISLQQPTLDDVFLNLTGHEAESKKVTKNGK